MMDLVDPFTLLPMMPMPAFVLADSLIFMPATIAPPIVAAAPIMPALAGLFFRVVNTILLPPVEYFS